jgi:hypothetical protein
MRERRDIEAGLPWPAADNGGPACLEGENRRSSAAFREDMGAHPHFGAVGPRVESSRRGRGSGHVPSRGPSCWVAIPGAWVGSSAERRSAAQTREEVGCQEGGRHRGDGLFGTAPGTVSVDGGSDRERDGEARNRGEGRGRDHSSDAFAPRAEAVAGKKCGASPSWTGSTSNGWKTS